MAAKILIDTNVAIAFLNEELPSAAADYLEKQELYISVITRIELLAWRNATPEHILLIEQFIAAVQVYNLEEVVIQQGILIRKNYNTKLPDAIIAATAIAYELTLSTRNVSDFKNISGIKFTNPWEG